MMLGLGLALKRCGLGLVNLTFVWPILLVSPPVERIFSTSGLNLSCFHIGHACQTRSWRHSCI